MKIISLFMLPFFILSSVFPNIFCAEDHSRIRILTYNVWYGFTKKPARKSEWLAYVKSLKPDVVRCKNSMGIHPSNLQKTLGFGGMNTRFT